MGPAIRALSHLGGGCGDRSKMFDDMPKDVAEKIPGFAKNGFIFGSSTYQALLSRGSVDIEHTLFQRKIINDADPSATTITAARRARDPLGNEDIAYLFHPAPPKKWKGLTRNVREIMEREQNPHLPDIDTIHKMHPLCGDHVFEVTCSIDEGKTWFEANILLSTVINTAKRMKKYDGADCHETVDLLMTMVHGEKWVEVLQQKKAVAKKAMEREAAVQAAVAALDKADDVTEDTVNQAAFEARLLETALEEVQTYRVLNPWRGEYPTEAEVEANERVKEMLVEIEKQKRQQAHLEEEEQQQKQASSSRGGRLRPRKTARASGPDATAAAAAAIAAVTAEEEGADDVDDDDGFTY